MSDLWYNNQNANTKTNFRNSGRTERVKREMQINWKIKNRNHESEIWTGKAQRTS